MSLIHNFVTKVLQFKGKYDEAMLEVQSFIAQLFCSILNTKKNQELLIINACLKRIDLVLMNIHDYFNDINPPIKRIFRNKPYNNEGFISSDEEIIQKIDSQSISKFKQPTNDQIKEQKLPIEDQVKMRDELIKKMTIGYLKDVQHLREMYVRKNLFPQEEIFDVSYYDYTNNLDPIIKQFIYNKILDLTQLFRLQIEKLTLQNSQYLNEIDKLKQLVKKIVGSAEITSQIRAILQIDKDLYKFWRGVQDVIGNEQIFEIFEKRKMGYGIDYFQIDQLIDQSQASGRLYHKFKKELEEQQIKLTFEVGREIQQLRKQINKLNSIVEEFDEIKKADFSQVKASIKEKVESLFEIKINTFMEKQKQDLQDELQKIANQDSQALIRRCIKGHALYKWIYFAKIQKLLNVSKIKRSLSNDKNQLSRNIYGLRDNGVVKLKKKMKILKEELLKVQMDLFEVQGENNQLKSKYNNLNYNFSMLIQKQIYMKQTLIQQENIISYFDKIYQFIKNKLGYNYLNINLKNSHYFLDKVDQHLQAFEQSIQQLKLDDQDLLKELIQEQVKRQIMYKKMYSNYYVNSFTLTVVYDINQPLQEPEHNINEFILQMNEQLKQTEIEDQQAEYDLKQAEDQYHLEQEEQQRTLLEEQQEELTKIQNSEAINIKNQKICKFLNNNDPNPFKFKIKNRNKNDTLAVFKTEQTEIQLLSFQQNNSQKPKMKTQSQQTNVSIDCSKCILNILEQMNPEKKNNNYDIKQQQQQEIISTNSINNYMQVSKSKYFNSKPQQLGTLFSQQNTQRMQSARCRRTTNTSYSIKPEKIDYSIIFNTERAQIFLKTKSHSNTQRKK